MDRFQIPTAISDGEGSSKESAEFGNKINSHWYLPNLFGTLIYFYLLLLLRIWQFPNDTLLLQPPQMCTKLTRKYNNF